MKIFLFDSWLSVFQIAILTVMVYVAVIFILRITGKRTLSKMNAFDFIVTIALGSTLPTIILNKNVPMADGIMLIFMLIILQYFITWLSLRARRFKRFITGTPTLLLYKGELLKEIMQKERILKKELYVVARSKGISNLSEVDAIILETNGELTLIEKLDKEAETISDAEGNDSIPI